MPEKPFGLALASRRFVHRRGQEFRRDTEVHQLPMPVIPGFNDHGPDIKAICDFLKPFEHVKYEMLPYHRLGTQKYTFLDRVPPMGDVTLDDKKFAALQKIAVATLGDRVVIPR